MTPQQPNQPNHISPEAREAASCIYKALFRGCDGLAEEDAAQIIQSALDKQKAEHEKEIAKYQDVVRICERTSKETMLVGCDGDGAGMGEGDTEEPTPLALLAKQALNNLKTP